jgi:phosphoribosylanthranilate isomerase
VIVKICGITREQDARLAVSLGATAIGFICWRSSPRYVAPADGARIAVVLPPSVRRVGVFVNADRDEIERVAREIGLDTVQLHGDESPELARDLGWPVIRALSLDAIGTSDVLERWANVPILLDAHDPVRHGGTGRTIDWDRAAQVARSREVILAGGLRPETIAEAVTRVRPAGVDVSSGVESAPGIKDESRLRALFDALRGVEA